MKVFKWATYLIALAAFIWFIFFREFTATADQEVVSDSSEQVEEPEVFDEVYDDPIPLDDDTAFEEFEEEVFDEQVGEEVIDKVEAFQPETASASGKYLVVAGSFGNHNNARNKSSELNTRGIASEIIKVGGLYRVVVGQTNELSQAQNIRNDLDAQNEACFILLSDQN